MLKLFYLEGRPKFQAPLAQSPAQIDGNGVEMGDLHKRQMVYVQNDNRDNLMKMIRNVENE